MALTQRRRASARVALILAAYPSRTAAARSARALVRDGVLACATVAGDATAFYRWEGRFHEEASVLLWGKTSWPRARAAAKAIAALHPDRVPEILTLEVDAASPAYAGWVAAATSAATKTASARAARSARRHAPAGRER